MSIIRFGFQNDSSVKIKSRSETSTETEKVVTVMCGASDNQPTTVQIRRGQSFRIKEHFFFQSIHFAKIKKQT